MIGAPQACGGGEEVLIVADAGPGAGLGHVARCSAIAAALRARGVESLRIAVGATQPPHSLLSWECVPAADRIPASSPRVLLLDSYLLDPGAVRARARPQRLVVMHDDGPLADHSDLTITTDPRLVGSRPQVVGGLTMTCLGPTFWGLPAPTPVSDRIGRVLVTTGGGDPGGHAVHLAVGLQRALSGTEVTLVRGPQAAFDDPAEVRVLDRPRSLLEPLMRADLAVTSAGSTLLEALAVGTPALAVILADNQRPTADALAARGATALYAPADVPAIVAAVAQLSRDPRAREQCVRRGRELVDGHGALRVAFLLWRMISGG